MQVLEPIGRHALNVRANIQRLQLGVSEAHSRLPCPVSVARAASYSKGQSPRTMFNGPDLSLLITPRQHIHTPLV
jgi:hypothetical protein